MPIKKQHKKDLKPKIKDQVGETIHNRKPKRKKVKYDHKNYWLEEEMEEIVPFRIKKKRTKDGK